MFSLRASRLVQTCAGRRLNSTLVVAEHANSQLNAVTLSAITAAKQIGHEITCLVAGAHCANVAAEVAKVGGVAKILVADSAAFEGALAERVAPVLLAAQKQFNFTHIIAGASAFGKSVLPRVAAKLDVSPISDIIGIKSADTFVRTIYAGNAIMTLKSTDPVKVITVRGTNFEAAAEEGGSATPEAAPASECDEAASQYVGQELSKSDRPELASAGNVVSGDLAHVPVVDIDASGRFKYVLVKVYTSDVKQDAGEFAYFVRGHAWGEYHSDIYDKFESQIAELGLDSECAGGGRIEHQPEQNKIEVFGYSQGYGRADHKITADLIKKKYPDCEVTTSNEGY